MHVCTVCNNIGFNEDGEVCCAISCTTRHDAAKGLKAWNPQEKKKKKKKEKNF